MGQNKLPTVLAIGYGGRGLAVADVLVGDVNPSGRLVDTCVASFDDYPTSAGFHESVDYVKYTEDIFKKLFIGSGNSAR